MGTKKAANASANLDLRVRVHDREFGFLRREHSGHRAFVTGVVEVLLEGWFWHPFYVAFRFSSQGILGVKRTGSQGSLETP